MTSPETINIAQSQDSDDNYEQNDTNHRPTWTERVTAQGAWDQHRTPEMLRGAPSLPMPVEIASPSSLVPIFAHLKNNAPIMDLNAVHGLEAHSYSTGCEPYYGTAYIEYEKGVVYADRRLDLCKMVVGPPGIVGLLDSLENNTFIKHFLLGNNIIGPAGCRRIAQFLKDHPDRMDTWYLAGNCITGGGLALMVPGLSSSVATNIWLKRNPLGPSAAADIAKLILDSPQLQTLDLDQTELGDEGVATIFHMLVSAHREEPISLKHLYMNSVGVGPKAAGSINAFLLSTPCRLESLFVSNNPLGDDGVKLLTANLNRVSGSTIQRLMLASTGLTHIGANAVLNSLTAHRTITTLDLGQSYATEDLRSRFNYITDPCVPSLTRFIHQTPNLKSLDMSSSALSHPAINTVISAILQSSTIVYVKLNTVIPPTGSHETVTARRECKGLKPVLQKRLAANVELTYNGISYEKFLEDEKRWLMGPKEDLRKIDSVYRNREAGLARRGLTRLDKYWAEGDETIEGVMNS